MQILGRAFIVAGLIVACAWLNWTLLGLILFILGAVQVWYDVGRGWTKVLWTILPPLIWLVWIAVLLSRMH